MKKILLIMALFIVSVMFTACSADLEDKTPDTGEQKKDDTIIESTNAKLCEEKQGSWIEAAEECVGISKETCESIGGDFNECASACRNDPDAEICTMQCIQVCEFGNIVIPDTCTSWFDGCNTCFVTEGDIGGCTRKACSPDMMEEARCLEFIV